MLKTAPSDVSEMLDSKEAVIEYLRLTAENELTEFFALLKLR